MTPRLRSVLILLAAGLLLAACPSAGRMHYQKGMTQLQARQYGPALVEFDAALAAEPESRMALFGKARCLYELRRFEEALPLFEQFLADTERDRASFSDERFDAAFYRDRCKQELGMEVPQDPTHIPPPPMGE